MGGGEDWQQHSAHENGQQEDGQEENDQKGQSGVEEQETALEVTEAVSEAARLVSEAPEGSQAAKRSDEPENCNHGPNEPGQTELLAASPGSKVQEPQERTFEGSES